MKLSRLAFVAAALFLAAPFIRAAEPAPAEQMDNPAFTAWTKFGVNSSQTLSGDIQAGQNKITMEMTRKLTEKAADHITLEVTSAMEIMGQKQNTPPHAMNIPAKTAKQDLTDLGTEDITAAGKTFKCHVYEMKGMAAQNPDAKAKIWVNDEIPGGLVKMEASSGRGTITQTLKSYESK